jgi:hypothetical protein
VTQLQRLVKPFPASYIHDNPGSGNRGSFVSHDVVTQRLLHVLGGYETEVVEVLRGTTAKHPDPVVVGVLLRLSCVIDGQRCSVTEAGDCENPSNWPHDGARMKDAMSDAIKRCAMRLGVALHLWSGGEFFLDRALAQDLESAAANPSLEEAS